MGATIEQTKTYPLDTSHDSISEDLKNWLVSQIGGFATAEIMEPIRKEISIPCQKTL
jgi:hypothetical protein